MFQYNIHDVINGLVPFPQYLACLEKFDTHILHRILQTHPEILLPFLQTCSNNNNHEDKKDLEYVHELLRKLQMYEQCSYDIGETHINYKHSEYDTMKKELIYCVGAVSMQSF